MEVFDAVRTVLAVRSYHDRPVPDAVMHRVVEAGRLTASSMNKQPWQFIVVREKENLRKLGAAVRSGPYVADAAFAIVVAVEHANPFGVSDASRAIQSMVLTAWADGVGSNWAGFGGMDEVKKILAIPAALDVLAVLPFGYPVDPIGRGRKQRKPLVEVAHSERYGQPFR